MEETLRQQMGEAAVRAARVVGYEGAGTCEFLLDSEGAFYFLEMNTRIQVEHPVTEAVTGIDLVEAQLRIAAGEPLPFSQEQIKISGHAIEARIYAEDPDKGFIPSPGRIEAWSAPSGPGIRLDSGFEGGQTVTAHYDPMVAKLIASGSDREHARARLAGALEEFQVAGPRTGLPFLRRLVEHPVFRVGRYDTSFIEREMAEPLAPLTGAERERLFALVAVCAARREGGDGSGAEPRCFEVSLPKQEALRVEVLSTGAPARVRIQETERELDMSSGDSPLVTLLDAGEVVRFAVVPRKKGGFDVGLRDRVLRVKIQASVD